MKTKKAAIKRIQKLAALVEGKSWLVQYVAKLEIKDLIREFSLTEKDLIKE